MKKINWLYIAILAFSSDALAQEKMLTVDEIFGTDPKVRVNFSGSPTRLQWANDGRSFKQVRDGQLMRIDALTNQGAAFFDSKKLAAALQAAKVKAEDAAKLANSPSLFFDKSERTILINNENDLWFYDVSAGTLKRLTNTKEEELEADFSPDGRWVSFVRGNNLFVVDVANGGEKQLTRDGAEKILNGYLDWVYQEELYGRGNFRGYWWSPDSRFIAFLRLDESPVPKFVLTNDIPDNQVVENTDYPMAGDPNPLVRLGIADVNKTSIIPNPGRIPRVGGRLPANVLRFGDVVKFADLSKYKPDDVLIARVAWAPDSRAVLFQALNREQTFLDLVAATLDGKVRIALTEETPAWVEVYDNPEFLSNGTAVWQSARNGWRHLYLYDNNGKMLRQLTNGKWEIRSLHGVDERNGWAYFSATKDSHIAENVYRVKLDGSAIERLTQGDGS
ncbi:MAG: DPP IV N-terminal domain-containing protein, partial [Acidobacteriota bacterium]|nr:DPP IV N-terminal domain-containing protein [Acidobacteriota bacterium]